MIVDDAITFRTFCHSVYNLLLAHPTFSFPNEMNVHRWHAQLHIVLSKHKRTTGYFAISILFPFVSLLVCVCVVTLYCFIGCCWIWGGAALKVSGNTHINRVWCMMYDGIVNISTFISINIHQFVRIHDSIIINIPNFSDFFSLWLLNVVQTIHLLLGGAEINMIASIALI